MRDDTTQTEPTPPADEGGEPGIPYLVVLVGTRAGEMFRVSKAATLLGRSDVADICLADDGISRRHAVLHVNGGVVTLEDLGSSNGTFCNGARVADPVVLSDGDKIAMGATTVLKFMHQDQIEKELNQRLYESAVRDDLTGLYNRRVFDERMDAEMKYALRHRAPLALLIADIDHFKRINDGYGHQTGDAVLREVATRLGATVRGEDLIARFGGEEFAILCRDTDEDQALRLAERLRIAIARQLACDDLVLRVTLSIGVAVVPGPNIGDAAELVGAADSALYEAKRSGRNRSVLLDRRARIRSAAR